MTDDSRTKSPPDENNNNITTMTTLDHKSTTTDFRHGDQSNDDGPTTCSSCSTSCSGEKTWDDATTWAVEQKLALMAGKAAFDLEGYIFRRVLPPTDIRPYIFPRTIDEMQSYIFNCSSDPVREEEMRTSREKWNELREQLEWTVLHEQVLTSVKQSYLMIKPPPDMIKDINANKRNTNDLIRAFRTSLPVHLRPTGDEIVRVMSQLNLI